MDSLTTILVALTAGASDGISNVTSQAISDSYNGLKQLLFARFDEQTELKSVLTQLEQHPKSDARQAVLKEELEKIDARELDSIAHEAEPLIKLLNASEEGTRCVQLASGNYISQASGNSTATVNVTSKLSDSSHE